MLSLLILAGGCEQEVHIFVFLLKVGVIALALCPSSFCPLPHRAFLLLSPTRCNEFSVAKRPLGNHFRERLWQCKKDRGNNRGAAETSSAREWLQGPAACPSLRWEIASQALTGTWRRHWRSLECSNSFFNPLTMEAGSRELGNPRLWEQLSLSSQHESRWAMSRAHTWI